MENLLRIIYFCETWTQTIQESTRVHLTSMLAVRVVLSLRLSWCTLWMVIEFVWTIFYTYKKRLKNSSIFLEFFIFSCICNSHAHYDWMNSLLQAKILKHTRTQRSCRAGGHRLTNYFPQYSRWTFFTIFLLQTEILNCVSLIFWDDEFIKC